MTNRKEMKLNMDESLKSLNEAIKLSGKKKTYLAEKMGISRAAFYLKLKGKFDFKADEALILLNELGISDVNVGKNFFAQKVGKNANTTN